MKKLYFLVFCLFFTHVAFSQVQPVVALESIDELSLISKKITFLEDTAKNTSIEDILKPEVQAQFKAYDKDIFIQSPTKNSHWLKVVFQNHSSEDAWLEVGGGLSCWYIDFYSPDSLGKYGKAILTGSMRPVENKVYPANLYWLPLAKAQDKNVKTYYIKMQSGRNPEYPLQIGSLKALHKNQRQFDAQSTAFVGWILVMIFYNLFLYFSIRERIYLYYVTYLILSIPMATNLNNYSFFEGINSSQTYFFAWNSPFYLSIYLFVSEYLELRKYPKLLGLLRFLTFGLCIFVPALHLLGFKVDELFNLYHLFALSLALSLYFIGVYAYFKGNKNAKYFILGWLFNITGGIIFVLVSRGILPFSLISRNAVYYGIALEILFFSLALADRINNLRKEKQKAQSDILELIQNQKKNLEQQVQERTEELQQQKKEINLQNNFLIAQSKELETANEAKNKLFAIVGHDLRGPIGSLESILGLMKQGIVTYEEFYNFVPQFYRNVKNMQNTLENLLEWSVSQMEGMNVNPSSFHINELIDEKIQLFKEIAKAKNITISTQMNTGLIVWADVNHVRLLLRNLINNALKFTPNNGNITIMTYSENNQAIISMIDSGVGMSEEQIKNLFQKNQTSTTYGTNGEKGTGLGLQLCYEIVVKNRGYIWASSEQGKGSTLSFSLPMIST